MTGGMVEKTKNTFAFSTMGPVHVAAGWSSSNRSYTR
jgi:hypothetical protein